MRIESLNSVFFLGIGGIGMSAIARYFNEVGVKVYGFDKTRTALTDTLESEGMEIIYEDDASLLTLDYDIVVYTPAIPNSSALKQALNYSGIEMYKRAEILGEISKDKFTIAIAGTHGKTSVSALTTHLLKSTGYDCTGFVGGICNNYGSNYIRGRKDVLVVEADEFDRSFLHLRPNVLVVTSLDPDHLDIYGDYREMKRAFEELIRQVKEKGRILLHEDVVESLGETSFGMLSEHAEFKGQSIDVYGSSKEVDYRSESVEVITDEFGIRKYQYSFVVDNQKVDTVQITVPGLHNVHNTTAGLSVAQLLNIDWEGMGKALASFEGIKRRFNTVASNANGVVYIDDYAHHPSELSFTIQTVRELYPEKSLLTVFQPHLFSRTQDFEDQFATELAKVDELILMPIYPAREEPIEGVTSEVLLSKVNLKTKKVLNSDSVVDSLKNRKDTVFLTVGAGNIDQLVQPLKELVSNE